MSGVDDLNARSIGLLMRHLGMVLPDPPAGQEGYAQAVSAIHRRLVGDYISTLENVPDALSIVDLQTGLILYCNTPMQSIFGLLRKELMFRLITDFLVLNDREKAAFLEGRRTILHHGQVQQAMGSGSRGRFKCTGNKTDGCITV